MTPGSFEHARTDPAGCAQWLNDAGGFNGTTTTVVWHDDQVTIFAVEFPVPPQDVLPGFPAEQVRVTVRSDGEIFTVPSSNGRRTWLHRYPHVHPTSTIAAKQLVPWASLLAALCLQYPNDPAHLRWNWSDGLDSYLRVVERHLWYEEQWRRTGTWPVEDTPHGERSDGTPHPLAPSVKAA